MKRAAGISSCTLLVATLLSLPTPALSAACSGSNSGRAYATVNDAPAPNNLGAASYVYAHSGKAIDWSSNGHINETLWEGTAGSTSLASWVEIGYTHGGFQSSNVFTFYWADKRPTHPYSEHIINTPGVSVGNWYNLMVKYTNNSTWTVYINGQQPNGGGGISVDNPANSQSMATGLESTDPGSNMGNSGDYAQSDNLQYYTTGGGWTTQWDPSTVKYTCGGASGTWLNTYKNWANWL